MVERRALIFGRLEEVPDEVDRLLLGHRALGGWSLAQVIYHLSTSIRLTTMGRVDAEARPPDPIEEIRRRKFFDDGWFPTDWEVPSAILEPPQGLDAGAEAGRLRRSIARFLGAPGPFPGHPYLGPLTAEEWRRFHQIHCAHHLSHIAVVDRDGCSEDLVI